MSFRSFLLLGLVVLVCVTTSLADGPRMQTAERFATGQLTRLGHKRLGWDKEAAGFVNFVGLYDRDASDATLRLLPRLSRLQALSLLPGSRSQVTDRGMRHIAELRQLEHLSLTGTGVTDAGLAHLRDLTKLKMVVLGPLTTDRGLVHLKELENVESLGLGFTKVTDRGLAQLAELPKVAQIRHLMVHATSITDAGVRDMHLDRWHCLHQLTLQGNAITGDVFNIFEIGATDDSRSVKPTAHCLESLAMPSNTVIESEVVPHVMQMMGSTRVRLNELRQTCRFDVDHAEMAALERASYAAANWADLGAFAEFDSAGHVVGVYFQRDDEPVNVSDLMNTYVSTDHLRRVSVAYSVSSDQQLAGIVGWTSRIPSVETLYVGQNNLTNNSVLTLAETLSGQAERASIIGLTEAGVHPAVAERLSDMVAAHDQIEDSNGKIRFLASDDEVYVEGLDLAESNYFRTHTLADLEELLRGFPVKALSIKGIPIADYAKLATTLPGLEKLYVTVSATDQLTEATADLSIETIRFGERSLSSEWSPIWETTKVRKFVPNHCPCEPKTEEQDDDPLIAQRQP